MNDKLKCVALQRRGQASSAHSEVFSIFLVKVENQKRQCGVQGGDNEGRQLFQGFSHSFSAKTEKTFLNLLIFFFLSAPRHNQNKTAQTQTKGE